MPDAVYLDTSSVVRFGLAASGSPDQRDIDGGAALLKVIESDARIAASPVTLAEYASVLHTCLRQSEGWLQGFGEEQLDHAEGELMALIARNRVRVRPLGPHSFEMGMSYVAAASREHGRAFKAWDAIHLYEACRWAREIEARVILATADADFQVFLGLFPEFEQHVQLLDTTSTAPSAGTS